MNPGFYRRAVRLQRKDMRVTAEMEDDFHHFEVVLEHDGERLLDVSANSLRFPWSTCGEEAANEMSELAGLRLDSLREQLAVAERWRQCTHMFDLAELAIAHVKRLNSTTLFEVEVEVVPGRGAIGATLLQDFRQEIMVRLIDGVLESPALYSGVPVGELREWALENLPADRAEMATILQRAIHVSYGRVYDWSFAGTASDMHLKPTCYTFGDKNSRRATPIADHVRDYNSNADSMLVDGIIRMPVPD